MVSVNNEWGKLRELFVGTIDNANIYRILNDILNKLDKIENKLNNHKRNMYDIILYIIIGMLLSFIIYATLSAIAIKK